MYAFYTDIQFDMTQYKFKHDLHRMFGTQIDMMYKLKPKVLNNMV